MTVPADDRVQVLRERGPDPFVTERLYLHAGDRHVWRSREHRRGLHHLHAAGTRAGWRPERLNLWIGSGFLVGSAFFALCSLVALLPGLADTLGLSEGQINSGFLAGSVFFTAAAYLQLFQAANPRAAPGGTPAPARRVTIGWRPRDIGWLSCLLQFVGTLLFNMSTFMTLHPSGNWLRDELVIWGPDLFGSVLFLASGYLAFAEASHGYWSWRPGSLPWLVVSVSLVGCAAFMVSAIYAFVPQNGPVPTMVEHAIGWTLIGAVAFMASAALMLIEGQ